MINTKSYQRLKILYSKFKSVHLADLFKHEQDRFKKFSLHFNGLMLDFSKNNINDEILQELINLSHELNLNKCIDDMFSGEKINNTENRPVLHTLLRDILIQDEAHDLYIDNENISFKVRANLQKMTDFSLKIEGGELKGFSNKKFTDVVNIGIGGSDLGPLLMTEALKPYGNSQLKVHFVSSIDAYQINDVLQDLNFETTLFIIASKTFTTLETLTNANLAKNWFITKLKSTKPLGIETEEQASKQLQKHFVGLTANVDEAIKFGISKECLFEFWDFVGGRYSLWGAIGLSAMLYIGANNFKELLKGAAHMDLHFKATTDYTQNLPVILALLSVWYVNFYNYSTQVISPYDIRLKRLPAYLQQLAMESNGKSVNKNGDPLTYSTCPVIWGDSGINGQHAYYQLLHQGTSINPMDIIISLSSKHSNQLQHDLLVSQALAQAESFLKGKSYEEALSELINSKVDEEQAKFLAKHKVFKGNRPTNMIILPEISPYYLGMLLALYEHKTFVEGVLWNIDSFDQMGVELGKKLAQEIAQEIKNKTIREHDDSTSNLIKYYLKESGDFT